MNAAFVTLGYPYDGSNPLSDEVVAGVLQSLSRTGKQHHRMLVVVEDPALYKDGVTAYARERPLMKSKVTAKLPNAQGKQQISVDIGHVFSPARGFFRRPHGGEHDVCDQAWDFALLLCSPNALFLRSAVWLKLVQFVRLKVVGNPTIVFPFAGTDFDRGSHANAAELTIGSGAPIAVSATPKTGSHGFRPVLRHLLGAFGHTPKPGSSVLGGGHAFIERVKAARHDFASLKREIDHHETIRCLGLGSFEYAFVHHLSFCPTELAEYGSVRCMYTIRDPRDLILSYARYSYVQGERESQSEREYVEQELDRFLSVSRIGLTPRQDFVFLMSSVKEIAADFVEAVELENVYCVRYEDLRRDPRGLFDGVIRWLGLERHGMYPAVSIAGALDRWIQDYSFESTVAKHGKTKKGNLATTAMSGTSGRWREFFSPDQRRLVKDQIGDELIALGYETDYDW